MSGNTQGGPGCECGVGGEYLSIPFNEGVYRYFKTLSAEDRVRETMRVLGFWAREPDLSDFNRDDLATVGSCIRFVLEELAEVVYRQERRETFQWVELGDWESVATILERGTDDLEIQKLAATIIRAAKDPKDRGETDTGGVRKGTDSAR